MVKIKIIKRGKDGIAIIKGSHQFFRKSSYNGYSKIT